tara:strand:- start:7037 stop:8794 length:1758 start_codon:yes stop_codon:yes gene_type:complete
MGGGLMQLVAYGAQDIYLSGNPQITFFKVVYRRHTNFSMESIQQTFNGDVGFDKKVTCTISRNGDLISKMYLEVDLHPLPITIQKGNIVSYPTIFNSFSYGYKDGETNFSKPLVSDLTGDGSLTVRIPNFFDNNIEIIPINDTNLVINNVIGPDPAPGITIVTISAKYTWTYAYDSYDQITDGTNTLSLNELELEPEYTVSRNTTFDEAIIEKDFTLEVFDTNNEIILYNYFQNNEGLKLIDENIFDVVEVESPTQTTTVQIKDELGNIYDVYESNGQFATYIETTPTNEISFPTQEWIGHKIIDYVEVEIGGQRIDKHYGDWLAIWNELTQTEGHWDGYKQMVEGSKLYIPLQFWFNRNPGLALPLIALQYHEVKLNIKFASKESTYTNLTNINNEIISWSDFDGIGDMQSASLYVDYIYLDTDERRRFAQVSHEYLIEQLQFTGDENVKNKVKLNFNHPVKELIWVEKLDGDQPTGEFATSYTKANIQLNGHDRFSSREPSYFQLVQPYQHHTRIPLHKDISVYSFSLQPEEHQPSGTCNMSRIDNATLYLENAFNGNTIKVFAINYNVLRVMSGMGGLAYSN